MADIKIPEDLLLPIPESRKEIDLYQTLQDYTKNVNDAFSTLKDISDITAGDGLTDTANTFSVNVDDATIETSGGNLQVKDDGIDKTKIASDVAGTGLTQAVGGELDVSINDTHIELRNNNFLLATDNAGTGTVDLFKVDTNDVIVAGTELQLINGTTINEFSTDGTLAGDSDAAVPTEKAVKTYVDNSSLAGIDVFTATGNDTWTAPTGVNFIWLTMIGGGGGAGGTLAGNAGAGGGGGGNSLINYPVRVTPSQAYGVTVGAGGADGAAGGGAGTDGGDTIFDTATVHITLTAEGGNAGNATAGGTAPAVPTVDRDGIIHSGTRAGGDEGLDEHYLLGGTGGAGEPANNGKGGGGGSSALGKGGSGGAAGAAGGTGTGYGGGGGGAGEGSSNGGHGSDGLIIIRYAIQS